MAQPPRTVVIQGTTPAGAACASLLNRAGVSVRMASSAGTVPSSLAVVSRALLGDLGLSESSLSQPIERIIERRLTEDGGLDSVKDLADVAIVQRSKLVEVLLGGIDVSAGDGSDDPTLTVEAGEFRLGDPKIQDPECLPLAKVSECISLDWDLGNAAGATWIRLNGEGLSDVNGRASILTTPNRAALILLLPMASIIETSISVVDVLAQVANSSSRQQHASGGGAGPCRHSDAPVGRSTPPDSPWRVDCAGWRGCRAGRSCPARPRTSIGHDRGGAHGRGDCRESCQRRAVEPDFPRLGGGRCAIDTCVSSIGTFRDADGFPAEVHNCE